MEPMLPDGSRVGQLVLARRPDRPQVEMVKRIAAVEGEGLVLLGDNPAQSTDSRVFGPVDRTAVIAVIRLRYWPIPPRRL